jgi:hypothetical protein
LPVPSRDFSNETLPGRERESLVNDIPAGDGKIADLFYSAHTDPNYISMDKLYIEENTGPHTGLHIYSSGPLFSVCIGNSRARSLHGYSTGPPFLPALENPGPQRCIFVHHVLCFSVCIEKSRARPLHFCPSGPLFSVCIGKYRVRPLHICPSGLLFSVCIVSQLVSS